jgi:copper chaperone CopZ
MSSGTLYCCDGLQKYELKVNMCCAKCAEKVKEEIFEVAGE